MKLEQGRAIAQSLAEMMRPFCHRVEIAGSIRRGKAEGIKDIEIVAIPRWEVRLDPSDLFQERQLDINLLHEWATSPGQVTVQWIKQGRAGNVPWKVKPEGRYWRGLVVVIDGIVLEEPTKLDLFLTGVDNFGAIFLQRTGSSEFSYAVAAHAKYVGKPFVDGSLTRDGEAVATPEEYDVFDLLGLQWVEPEQRNIWSDVRSRSMSPAVSLKTGEGDAPAIEAHEAVPEQETAQMGSPLDRFIWHAGDIEIIQPPVNEASPDNLS